MQPIKTTNAMNPAPAKGIESFPTPVIDDVVISEIVNSWKGDYQPLEYGTLWKNVSHAPNQGSFPEHKLVYQQPTSEDGQWVKRIWVNDRVNQDSYNYAIKYSAGSQEHPIYIRTYILPRATYAPLLDGTPDPLFPKALLVDEEAVRNEGELDSEYITVTRVYETLPGPAVPTRRYNERGDLETVIVQTVPPNTPPTPDGLLVTQSQVEQVETGKGVKTTATVQDHALLQIKEKKEGLLGETITTDDIVDPSTNPDALSQTVIASTVEQYTATKARKRTTTASGPTSLSQKSKDGKLLGDITSTESVVFPSSSPDPVSSKILSSEVRQVDSGKAIKRNVVLNSTPTLSGNQNEQGLLGIKATKESIVAAGDSADPLSLSVISSAVEPIDSVRSRKITITSTGPSSLSGGQKKEGLLGETSVHESIVAAGTQPDALSKTVVSSVVEPIDAAKSRKVTITSSGPNTLTQKSKDGKLLGDTITTESVVDPNGEPDEVNSNILSSEVRRIDSGKAIKRNVVLRGTPTLSGIQNEQGLLGRKSTVESIVPAGTPADALNQTILSSQVEPIDSVRSRKVTVQSFGPTQLAGQRINERGDVERVYESIVPANTPADLDDLLQISSEVVPIDESKSKKTTTKVDSHATLITREKKAGLLGETTTVETIVPQDTFPDPLTTSTVSSIVEAISKNKSRKRLTTGSPSSLTSNTLFDSPLGPVKCKLENSIVEPEAEPVNSFVTIKDSITPIDSSKSERQFIEVIGEWPVNTGVDSDEQIGFGVKYTETIVETKELQDKEWEEVGYIDYKPIDQYKLLKRSIDRESLRNVLLKKWLRIPFEVDVDLPDKLLGVKVYWGKSYGEGDSFSTDFGASSGNFSLSSSGSSKDSAGISGDIYFNIEKGYSGPVRGEKHIFFIEIGEDGQVTKEEIIKVLNDLHENKDRTKSNESGGAGPGLPFNETVYVINSYYKPWPYIRLRSENIVIISGAKSKTFNVSQAQYNSINGGGGGGGKGSSIDVDVNARSVSIPPSLHDKITIGEEFFGTGNPDLEPTYGIRPTELEPTNAKVGSTITPMPAFPVGNYLYKADVELYKHGFVKVTAITASVTSEYV